MERVWQTTAKVVSGLFVCAMCAMPQGTISARPGVVNYVEGHAYVDGRELNANKLKGVALYANQTLTTDLGKAEVLLTPGVFLRIGDNSAIRMISPSLTDTQFEITKGEAMIEAAQVVKDNNIEVIDHGAVIHIEKIGLYRISGENPPTVSVFEGEANVEMGNENQQLKKDRELVLSAGFRPQKFDPKKEDNLYAWSNVRSEYEAGASYASARTAAASYTNGGGAGYSGVGNGFDGLGYGVGGLGSSFGGGFGPGWFYNSPWNSWAWLPGAGYAFSPFGYGFFSPGLVGYAPVVYGGVGPYGRGLVAVNPSHPPAQGAALRSPAALSTARSVALHSGVGDRAMMAASRSGITGGGGHIGAGAGAAHASSGFSGGGHAGGMSAGGHAGGGGGHR